jgi:hypothetical protein
MFDELIKSMKIPNWKDAVPESTKKFIDTYSSPKNLGHLAQVMAQASIMDLRHLVAITQVIFVLNINLFDTARIHEMFFIKHEFRESATQHLQDLLAHTQVSPMET